MSGDNHFDEIEIDYQMIFKCIILSALIIGGVAVRPIMYVAAAFVVVFMITESTCNQFILYFWILPFANIFKFSVSSTSIFTYYQFVLVGVYFIKKRKIDRKFLIGYIVYLALLVSGFDLNFSVLLKQAVIPLVIYVFFEDVEEKVNQTQLLMTYSFSVIYASFIALFREQIPNLQDYTGLKIAYELGLDVKRFCGLYTDPNYYTLTLLLGLSSMIFLYSKKRIRSIVFLYYVAVAYFGSLTVSKSFLLMFSVVTLLFIVSLFSSKNYFAGCCTLLVLAIAFFLVINGTVSLFDNIFSRIESASGDLTTNRINLWESYMTYIMGNPKILFIGAGISAGYLGAAAHNTYIDFLYYYGFLGTVVFAYTCIYAVKKNKEEVKKSFANFVPLISTAILFFALSSLMFFDFTGILVIVFYIFRANPKDEMTESRIGA